MTSPFHRAFPRIPSARALPSMADQVPVSAHAAALRHFAFHAAHLAQDDRDRLAFVSGLLERDQVGIARVVIDGLDTELRDLVVDHVHPARWTNLGTEALDPVLALATYAARFMRGWRGAVSVDVLRALRHGRARGLDLQDLLEVAEAATEDQVTRDGAEALAAMTEVERVETFGPGARTALDEAQAVLEECDRRARLGLAPLPYRGQDVA